MRLVFRLLELLYRVFDFSLKLLFEAIVLIPTLVLGAIFSRRSTVKKDTICILKRYHDTIQKHKDSNSLSYLSTVFVRKPFKYAYVLCAGDGCTQVRRWGRRVVNIDIKVAELKRLKRTLPHLACSVRDYLAFLQTLAFLVKTGIRVVEIDFPSNLMIRALRLKYALNLKLVTKVIGNTDLIYHQSKFPLFFPFQLKSKVGDLVHRLYDLLISFIYFRSCSVVIGANRNNFDNAISKGACPNKSYLVRIKIDREILRYPVLERSELDLFPQNGRVVLVWSRIAREMMVDTAALSMVELLKNDKNLHLVFIGTGSEVDNLNRIATMNNISDQIHLVGYRSRQYIRSAVAYSDVVLSPYGGSALVEAALLKCPVVAFDYEWQSELVMHNYTGLLADFRDLEDIAQKVKYMLDNKDIAIQMGQKLDHLAIRIFNDDVTDLNLIQAYSKLL